LDPFHAMTHNSVVKEVMVTPPLLTVTERAGGAGDMRRVTTRRAQLEEGSSYPTPNPAVNPIRHHGAGMNRLRVMDEGNEIMADLLPYQD